MNLMGAVLVSLWALGWMIAAVRAVMKARAQTRPAIPRPEFP
jgi:hypothetical protein